MRLVDDDLADQKILEDIIEEAKPPVPANARHLHWLLATPFRYAPGIGGSRFRARGEAIQVLVYESVRDPQRGDCIAVLDSAALVNSDPLALAQSWYLTVREHGVIWQRDGRHDFQFDFRMFEA